MINLNKIKYGKSGHGPISFYNNLKQFIQNVLLNIQMLSKTPCRQCFRQGLNIVSTPPDEEDDSEKQNKADLFIVHDSLVDCSVRALVNDTLY